MYSLVSANRKPQALKQAVLDVVTTYGAPAAASSYLGDQQSFKIRVWGLGGGSGGVRVWAD